MNAGAALDANIIWSAQSFVPRSVMANLKVDLFGETVDLLELGGRAEGLEAMLEALFGGAQEGNTVGEGLGAAPVESNALQVLAQKVRSQLCLPYTAHVCTAVRNCHSYCGNISDVGQAGFFHLDVAEEFQLEDLWYCENCCFQFQRVNVE